MSCSSPSMNCTAYLKNEYLTALRVQSFIETPITFFTFYVVVFHSPLPMRHFKWLLFGQNLVILLFQILMTDLSKPVFYVPATAVIFNGLLNDFVPADVQMVLFFGVNFSLYAWTVALFEYRHQIVVPITSWAKFSLRFRVTNFCWRILVAIALGCSFWLFASDQIEARADWKRKIPCAINLVETIDNTSSSIFYLASDFAFCMALFGFALVTNLAEIFFYVIDAFRILNGREHLTTMSTRTKAMQKSFLNSLIIQEATPVLLAYSFPMTYLLSSLIFGFMSIDVNNLCLLISLFHGGLASLCTILANRPYRFFVKSTFFRLLKRPIVNPVFNYSTTNNNNKNNSIHWNPPLKRVYFRTDLRFGGYILVSQHCPSSKAKGITKDSILSKDALFRFTLTFDGRL